MVAGSCYACSKGVDLAVMKSNQLWEKITKYNISASNVYNFDKKDSRSVSLAPPSKLSPGTNDIEMI